MAAAVVPLGRSRHHTSFLHLLLDQQFTEHGLETQSQTVALRAGCCAYGRVFPALSYGSAHRCEVEKCECVAKEGSPVDLVGCGVTRMPNGSVFLPAVGSKFWQSKGFGFSGFLIAAMGVPLVLVGFWQKVENQVFGETGLCCIVMPE